MSVVSIPVATLLFSLVSTTGLPERLIRRDGVSGQYLVWKLMGSCAWQLSSERTSVSYSPSHVSTEKQRFFYAVLPSLDARYSQTVYPLRSCSEREISSRNGPVRKREALMDTTCVLSFCPWHFSTDKRECDSLQGQRGCRFTEVGDS